MQLQKFPQRYTLKRTEAPGTLVVEELLGFLRREALNHTPSIPRNTLYVNNTIAAATPFGLKRALCAPDSFAEAAAFDLPRHFAAASPAIFPIFH
jgi:hypothetical protein